MQLLEYKGFSGVHINPVLGQVLLPVSHKESDFNDKNNIMHFQAWTPPPFFNTCAIFFLLSPYSLTLRSCHAKRQPVQIHLFFS